ncbi:MAG: site-specific tyrosine recombinase [Candidatus Scalindua rubra]|uniref:Site-specific tyrosine recombinase n=1 Tax=Candidatus Scalindua rubra TaxID=1872076 RepID=A0A1E3X2V8_9BACT|nr:MAG: site-specific tyrosine recombinase [Candidatus Scalindua rubra]
MSTPEKRESHPGALSSFESKLIADGKSPHTVSSYCRDVKVFLTFTDGETVTEELLNEYFSSVGLLNEKNGKKRDTTSVNKIKSSLKAYFKYLHKTGMMDADLSEAIKLKSTQRKEPTYLSHIERTRLLKTFRSTKGSLAFRDNAMFTTMLLTGIRVDALIKLNLEDVNLDDKKLTTRTKGDKISKVFLNSRLRGILKRYLKYRRKLASESDALFLSNRLTRITSRQVSFRLKHWLTKANITKAISPHSLRHTFATELLQKTQNLRIVQKALGHEYLETTKIYTHILDDEMEEALELL